MMMQFLVLGVACCLISVLWLAVSTLSKPIYNKMSNVWEEDPAKRQMLHICVGLIIIVAFFAGLMFCFC
jgi:hypothetical protein